MTKQIHFYKYQGTGNDFVIIDTRNQQTEFNNGELNKKQIYSIEPNSCKIK